ncbi:MAG: hypothetical protein AUG51_17125 [Acidobacteria bacterium 13_1_20CM_3_53_8]|nr:MAG: hypothetical protein AUG51_17125 [Acidobacteria bacterium 13_1_20CM_3_53_8]
MITGFNTDVEHSGVVYHVQTEDKGLDSPLILSLVYSGGAILASKRSPYNDLIVEGFDEAILAERLQRQHRLICAAIQAGRIEDLKRMTQRSAATRAPRPIISEERPQVSPTQPEISQAQPPVDAQSLPEAHPTDTTGFPHTEAAQDALHLDLLEERELRSGEYVTLRVRVSHGPMGSKVAVHDAPVTVKVLGTTFKPVISSATTDRDGVALVFVSIPKFNAGRAALLIRVEMDGREAELRRIIHSA